MFMSFIIYLATDVITIFTKNDFSGQIRLLRKAENAR